MKRLLISLVTTFFVVWPVFSSPDTSQAIDEIKTLELASGTYRYVDRRLLVQGRERASTSALSDLCSKWGGAIENASSVAHDGFAVVVFPALADVLEIRESLRREPLVKSANLDYVGCFATTDPYYSQQWALQNVKAPMAWNKYTKGNSSVVIAILDSGFSSHEDLLLDNPRIIQDASKYNFTNAVRYGDDQDHAMGVAGIVASETDNATGIAGVAWYPKLWFIKVGKPSPDGYGIVYCSWLARGIRCVVDTARAHPDIHYVINASVGINLPDSCAQGLGSAIASADSNNVLIAASVGNTDEPDDPKALVLYPAMFSRMSCDTHYCNVVSVGAVDVDDHWAGYSRYRGGDECDVYVDLSAPGGLSSRPIVSLSSNPDSVYRHLTGTSCAAAHVSGAAALIWSLNPFLSHYDVKHILKVSASRTEGYTYGRDPWWCKTPEDTLQVLDEFSPICGDYAYHRKQGTGVIDIDSALSIATEHGIVSSNDTLSGDIVVGGDLTIEAGITLTILPGSTIHIIRSDYEASGEDTSRVEIIVQGTLVADGTSQNPIVFKSFADDPQPEDWCGIWFTEASSGSLSHCTIEHAKYGLKRDSEIDIESCELIWEQYSHVLNDLTIDEGLTLTVKPGTTVDFAPEDTARSLPDTLRVALNVKGVLNACGTTNDAIVFKSSSDEPLPGDWYGICYSDEEASGSLSHCVIQDARYGVQSKVAIQITDCEITNCMTAGMYMWDTLQAGDVVNNTSTIRRCHIHDNLIPDAAGMRIWNCPDTIVVDSCTTTANGIGIWVSNACPKITSSTASGNDVRGIWVTSYQYPSPYPYPVIRWCHTQGNGEEGIKCEYNGAKISYSKSWENGTYGVLAYGPDADPVFEHSKIMDNPAAGLRVDSYAYPVLGNASLGQGQYNSLYGQDQAKNVYNTTSQYIYAQNCWWGSSPPNPNKFQGRVTYQPYLTSDPVYYLAPMKPNLPTVLSLEQNFPNPFNGVTGVTRIKYCIPSQRERVVLTIYDVTGSRVRTLVDKPHAQGYFYALWDGRNDRGLSVAPGVYFCEMNVGKQSFTKKMVLFR